MSQHNRDSLVFLLSQVAKRDRRSFAALYQATSRKLYGIILRILVQEALAEEILQEVYLKVWDRAGDFDQAVASPITWMSTIARNRALDEVRKRRLDTDSDNELIESLAAEQLSPLASAEVANDLERLQACLDLLEKPRGEMVLHAYLQGVSRDALAQQYQQPLGTIKTWLHRSLKQLKDCLGS